MAASLRRLGQNIEKASQTIYSNVEDFAKAVGLSITDLNKVFEGRLILPPLEFKRISQIINIPLNQLLNTTGDYTFVECMGNFREKENEDKILDLIDDYIDLVEAIS